MARIPDYGPGSINRKALARAKALPPIPAKNVASKTIQGEGGAKPKTTLLNALSPSAAQIENRIKTEQKAKKEVGGRR